MRVLVSGSGAACTYRLTVSMKYELLAAKAITTGLDNAVKLVFRPA